MVNDGGPAFPRPDWNGSWVGPDSYSGMSLRAYIATHVRPLDFDFPDYASAAKWMGEPEPRGHPETFEFHGKLVAKIRVMQADALIAELEK